jgi:tetratricopeptide (TPR) repeat protein
MSHHAGAERTLAHGREAQCAGQMAVALECFAQAVDLAQATGDRELEAAARRHLAVVHHLRGEARAALRLCLQSRDLALEIGHDRLAAEALIALANLHYEEGRLSAALAQYRLAAKFGASDVEIRARVAQNLGMLASVQGRLDQAVEHYDEALNLYEAHGDHYGQAMVHHNLGMVHADRHDWDSGDREFVQATELADRSGNQHLKGLCLLNRAEVHLAHERFDVVRDLAEGALGIFRALDARRDEAGALRLLGVVDRHLRHPTLAESRLRSALEIAEATGQRLLVAETSRDMALLCQDTGRGAEALKWLTRAEKVFAGLGARLDVQDVAARKAELVSD